MVKRKLQHKSFWVILGAMFLLSAMMMLAIQSEPSLITGGATVQGIDYLPAGRELFFEARDIVGLQYVKVQVAQTVKEGKIVITQDAKIPFDGVALSKFKVVSQDATKFGPGELKLKVKASSLSFAAQDLKLYINGEVVPTILTSKDVYLIYTATIPQFKEGQYVIGKKTAVVAAPTPDAVQKVAEVPVVEKIAEVAQQQPAPVEAVEVPKLNWWQRFLAFIGFG